MRHPSTGTVWTRILGRASALIATSLALSEARAATTDEALPARNSTHDEASQVPGDGMSETARDAKTRVPIVAFTYGAQGVPAKTAGAQGYGTALAAADQGGTWGGGATVWGSPVDRLTLMADAPRDVYGRFTPSLAALGRLLGNAQQGWVLGAIGKWKAEGFGVGPHGDEIESELEGGLLLSFRDLRWHFDSNAIAGGALGGSGEADAEARLRFGYDLARLVRLGMDGQARLRIGRPKYLPNGRIWDFAAGAQVLLGNADFFGAFTAGPSTMGVLTDAIGATAILSLGGST